MQPRAVAPRPEGKKATPQTLTVRPEAELEYEIRTHPNYLSLDQEHKNATTTILGIIKSIPLGDVPRNRIYYLQKLKLAITTPVKATNNQPEQQESDRKKKDACSSEMKAQNNTEINSAVAAASICSVKGPDTSPSDSEVAKGTHFVKRFGAFAHSHVTYLVDDSNPRKIRVKAKVWLKGKPEDVSRIRALEHDIERACNAPGYWVDLEFVDGPGSDVFTIEVKPCEWANSSNWAGGPLTLSHELHHAFGLSDRYDYIESHSDNTYMTVSYRLRLFLEQIQKGVPSGRDTYSKMHSNDNPLLSEDICAVAQGDQKRQQACEEKRKDLDPPGIPPPPR